jgi:hypothetical protein
MPKRSANPQLEQERYRIELEQERRETEALLRRYGCIPPKAGEDDRPPVDDSPPELFTCSSPLCPGLPWGRPYGGRHAHCIRLDRMARRAHREDE